MFRTEHFLTDRATGGKFSQENRRHCYQATYATLLLDHRAPHQVTRIPLPCTCLVRSLMVVVVDMAYKTVEVFSLISVLTL